MFGRRLSFGLADVRGVCCGAAVLRSAAVLATALCLATVPAGAKTPGAVYCFSGTCHRVNTLDEMSALVGRTGVLVASYYDDCRRDRFNPCGLTSSGAVFHADSADNAASPVFPDGTVLLVFNPANARAAVLRVTNAGPYRANRMLDVSRATAGALGFIKSGTAELKVSVLKPPELSEAHYRKMRRYVPVPGYIGEFPTFADAEASATVQLEAAQALTPGATSPSLEDAAQSAPVPEPLPVVTGEARPLPPASEELAEIAPVRELAPAIFPVPQNLAAIEQVQSAGPEIAAREQTLFEEIAGLIAIAREKAQPRTAITHLPQLKGLRPGAGFAEKFATLVAAARCSASRQMHAMRTCRIGLAHASD
jgi:rare lipoprotein A